MFKREESKVIEMGGKSWEISVKRYLDNCEVV